MSDGKRESLNVWIKWVKETLGLRKLVLALLLCLIEFVHLPKTLGGLLFIDTPAVQSTQRTSSMGDGSNSNKGCSVYEED